MERSYRVLIVDDESEIKDLLGTFLTSKGHSCETASDGNGALAKFESSIFDAVVTDIKMPDMDGIALTREITRRNSGVAVMVMTGFTGEYTEEDAVEAGSMDFIAKPFTLGEFSARFQRMMRDREVLLENRKKDERLKDEIMTALREESEEKIKSLKREIDELRDMALYDELTCLPNRKLFFERLTQSIESAKRYSHSLALLFLDLDYFKNVNDNWGHDVGDLLLKGVASRLSGCVRKSDIVARMGGDEFTIILVHITEETEAAAVAGRAIASLSQTFHPGGRECTIGASFGISIFPTDGDDPEVLFKKADTAMYRVKEGGRNGYQFYDHGIVDIS